MPHQIGGPSKEEIIMRVRCSGCKMLDGLKIEEMRRSQIISHLEKSCCPVLKKLYAECRNGAP